MDEERTTKKLPLPDAFVEFLNDNGIDSEIYASPDILNLPRYIRVKPGVEHEISDIENDLCCKLDPVSWLPGFFCIPSNVKIASSNAYKEGKIYGIDAASGASVFALEVSNGEHILDLCAAPGAKHCMLAEFLENSGTLTGVDISMQRLAACRTMLQKYDKGDRSRLFLADGTSFSLLPVRKSMELTNGKEDAVGKCVDRTLLDERKLYSAQTVSNIYDEWDIKKKQKKRYGSKARKSSYIKEKSGEKCVPELVFYGKYSGVVGLDRASLYETISAERALYDGYDKVLVDAECTHDGSIKHIAKYEKWGWSTLAHRLLAAERINSITHLQLQLLSNGFKLLRAGGILVYSTCSLTTAQNEGVIEAFLAAHPDAELQEIPVANNWPSRAGGLKHTLRFDPLISNTSGLFIAKIFKKKCRTVQIYSQ